MFVSRTIAPILVQVLMAGSLAPQLSDAKSGDRAS